MADYDIPVDLMYSREDEWIRDEHDRVVVGVTDYAQDQLGDIVFVELPEVGTAVSKGESFGVIESVKAVSDLCAPVGGVVAAVNDELEDRPEAVNESCYGAGWIIEIAEVSREDIDSLLDAAGYQTHIDERSE
ncbi:MAG: glycine cleavage system protein GcvH [Myxococcota bacterium]